MPITGWIAILVLIVMCYMLIKQYETRMVLFGGGFILCCISLSPMAGLNAFAKTMTNGALIMAICSATGFAYCVTFTECDRSLVHYLTRPIRNVGILMIPITSLLTFAINIAIPSAAGVGAVVGTTLIPLLLRAGFKPAAAAAAVLMGTTGSLLSPGLSHNAYVSDMAHMSIMDLISYHGIYSLMIGVVGAVGLCIVCWVLGDNKGEKIAEANPASDAEPSNFKANPIKAFVPLIPIILMLVFTFWIPSVKMGVAQAMLIGTIVCLIVAMCDPQKFSKQFFKGMGDSYGSIMGIIIAAGVLAAGLTASGLIKGLIALMVQSKEIAQWGGSIGPFVLSVLMGSGDAGAMAFNSAVTPHAQEFGMQIHSLGSLAFLAGSPKAQGKGVLVALNGAIHGARDVVKTNSVAVETFKSPNSGPLGYIIGDQIEFLTESAKPHTLQSCFEVDETDTADKYPKVCALLCCADQNSDFLEAAIDKDYHGIVLSCTGNGSIPLVFEPVLQKARNVICVRSSRTGSGPVTEGMTRWQVNGIIPSGTLNPQKARILLQLSLKKFGLDQEKIKEIFKTY